MKNLYDDNRDEQYDIRFNNEGPPVLKIEVQNVLKRESWQGPRFR